MKMLPQKIYVGKKIFLNHIKIILEAFKKVFKLSKKIPKAINTFPIASNIVHIISKIISSQSASFPRSSVGMQICPQTLCIPTEDRGNEACSA